MAKHLKHYKEPSKLLRELDFDPIRRTTELYERLIVEDSYWTDVRQGKVLIENSASELVTMRYSSVAHSACLNLLNKATNDLMRYGYARVSEEENKLDVDKVPSLIINLSGE